MNSLEVILRETRTLLDERDLPWALVGGLAVSVRSEPRFTRDTDIAVAVETDEEAERLVGELRAAGYRVLATVEQESVGRFATVRLLPPGQAEGGIITDLLFASSGIEPEIAAAAEVLEVLPGLLVPVARVGHLIALKVLARDDEARPQDAADLVALLREADAEEIGRAKEALALVAARGYHRDRDLASLFRELVEGRVAP